MASPGIDAKELTNKELRQHVLKGLTSLRKGAFFTEFGLSEEVSLLGDPGDQSNLPDRSDRQHPFNKLLSAVAAAIVKELGIEKKKKKFVRHYEETLHSSRKKWANVIRKAEGPKRTSYASSSTIGEADMESQAKTVEGEQNGTEQVQPSKTVEPSGDEKRKPGKSKKRLLKLVESSSKPKKQKIAPKKVDNEIDSFESDEGSEEGFVKRESFEKEKVAILADVPDSVKKRFGEIGFTKWSKDTLPVLILSPYDVPPGDVRATWFSMYDKVKAANRLANMTNLIYWYGSGDDPQNAFSLIASSKIISYEDGVRKGLDQVPKSLTKKLETDKKLSSGQQLLLRGLEEMSEDLKKSPEERRTLMEPFKEVYESASEGGHQDQGEDMDDFMEDNPRNTAAPKKKDKKKSKKSLNETLDDPAEAPKPKKPKKSTKKKIKSDQAEPRIDLQSNIIQKSEAIDKLEMEPSDLVEENQLKSKGKNKKKKGGKKKMPLAEESLPEASKVQTPQSEYQPPNSHDEAILSGKNGNSQVSVEKEIEVKPELEEEEAADASSESRPLAQEKGQAPLADSTVDDNLEHDIESESDEADDDFQPEPTTKSKKKGLKKSKETPTKKGLVDDDPEQEIESESDEADDDFQPEPTAKSKKKALKKSKEPPKKKGTTAKVKLEKKKALKPKKSMSIEKLWKVEQDVFEQCEDSSLDILKEWKDAILEKDVTRINRTMEQLLNMVDTFSASFLEAYEFSTLIKETKKIVDNDTRKQLLRKMKDCYLSKKSEIPTGFKPRKRSEGNNSEEANDTTGEDADIVKDEPSNADTREDEAESTVAKEPATNDSVPPSNSIAATTQVTSIPKANPENIPKPSPAKPERRKKFSLGSLMRPSSKEPKVSTKAVMEIQPSSASTVTRQPKLPTWILEESTATKEVFSDKNRLFALEFLQQATQFIPKGKLVNHDAIASALEVSIFDWARKLQKESWVDNYWKKVHEIVAAISGKKEPGTLATLIGEGKFQKPSDIVNLQETALVNSFESRPL